MQVVLTAAALHVVVGLKIAVLLVCGPVMVLGMRRMEPWVREWIREGRFGRSTVFWR